MFHVFSNVSKLEDRRNIQLLNILYNLKEKNLYRKEGPRLAHVACSYVFVLTLSIQGCMQHRHTIYVSTFGETCLTLTRIWKLEDNLRNILKTSPEFSLKS